MTEPTTTPPGDSEEPSQTPATPSSASDQASATTGAGAGNTGSPGTASSDAASPAGASPSTGSDSAGSGAIGSGAATPASGAADAASGTGTASSGTADSGAASGTAVPGPGSASTTPPAAASGAAATNVSPASGDAQRVSTGPESASAGARPASAEAQSASAGEQPAAQQTDTAQQWSTPGSQQAAPAGSEWSASGGAPQSGYPQPGYPQPGYPQPGYPQSGYPQSGPQQPGYPQSGPQPTYQQPGYPQAAYQQPGYQQPGQPPTAYAPPGYPQPGYGQPGYGQAGPGGGSFGPPPQGPGGQWSQGGPGPGRFGKRGPIWIGVGVLAVVAIIVGILVAVNQLGPKDPDETVSAAVEDLKTWGGITYRGEITQYSKGNIRVDLTVDPNGDIAGTLMRPDGARADYARINGVELFKGEASWWKGDSQETDKVQRLAGIWVSNPSTEVSGISTQISGPDKVASDLEPPGLGGTTGFSLYRESGTRDVAGQTGRVLDGIGRKVIVSQDGDHLLAVIPLLSEVPLEVSRPDPAALGRINERRSIRDTAPDYTKAMYEKPNVTVQVLGTAGVCTTPECTATVRLTNKSRFDAKGSVQVTVNGEYADFKTFTLRGGQSQDLQVSARNPATPGQTIPVRWEAEVTAY